MTTNNAALPENWLRNIILFLSSQTISLFGSSLVQYAIMWHITLTTQSGLMMTLYIICGFIPTFLLSPVAGVWADRYNRKRLIMAADGLIAVATLILAVLFLMGFDSIWLLFAIAAVRAFGSGIQMPAVGAILPQIVPKDQLTKVNGVNGSIQAMIMFASPMVGAALLGMMPLEWIFFVDVATAAIAIVTLSFLKVSVHEKAAGTQEAGYFSDFKEGLRYVNRHSFLKPFFLFFAVFFVLMAPAAFLTPLQVARSFNGGEWQLAAVEVAFSIGMMAGGAVIAFWGGFRNKNNTLGLGSMIMGVCTLALGVVPDFWVYLAFMALFGVAVPFFNTPATVLLQEKVEEAYLGRVFGVMSMISTSMMPLGMLLFGPLSDVIKIEWMLIGTGILILLLAYFLMRNKQLIEAGKPAV
ncbi:MFS transporter [Domibacillus enclensis]|uniref:MFS transporter n=1 Tax=Domibacillus enclensis TaxID=1017273 RepID=A0A1N6X486_9BACI|nr:MFS transporter [Domibacillus enclensis]OXS78106.1 MFS transporter [Domibacillus enclensis]SIQ97070.1 MFS transporter, DHA3 family, macrolide efflux protein [Domibacillus enclensis]